MHERYSWPQSHDLFLAHVNRQFLCRETRIEGGGGGWSQWWGRGGGAGPGIKWEKKQSLFHLDDLKFICFYVTRARQWRVTVLQGASSPSAHSVSDRKWKCSEFFMWLLKYLQNVFELLLRGVRGVRSRFCPLQMRHISQVRVRILLPACSNKRTSRRVRLTGAAHLSRGEDGLLRRTHRVRI